MLRFLAVVALLVSPAIAHAQVPMGGGMMGPGARGMGGMGPDPTRAPAPDRPRVAKSDEIVSLGAFLRGVTLTPDQKTQVEAIEAKFNPLLLPALDVVREETEAGKNGDAERLQKYQARANRYREQELAELRLVLDPAQLVRFERNVAETRRNTGTPFARP
ncbi:MAG: hypothetical protein ACK5Z1_03615 [Gemmatimonadota bacterium]